MPLLIIDCEKEWLWDIKEHGEQVVADVKARGHAPAEYRVLPDLAHLDVYQPTSGANQLALEWFTKYL